MSRALLAAAAAAVSVAATAVIVTAVSSPEQSTADPPRREATHTPAAGRTPTPFRPVGDHDWLRAVPEDFSVSAGLPEGGGDISRVSEPVTWTFCEEQAFPVGEALDVRRDGATGPEYADRRDLRVFRDDRAAHDFLSRAAAVARDCPEEQHGATRWLHTVAPVDGLGEESVRMVQTYETDGMVNAGATWWNVIRVGNTVLLTATGGEYLPGETLGQGIRDHDRLLAPIVASMCVFGVTGCGAAADIPGAFPLAGGWPPEDQVEAGGSYGLTGPDRALEPLSWNLCDQPFTATGSTDRLRADWSNVEDFRSRELLTFAAADEAADFMSSFVSYWRGCDRYASGAGYESVQDVRLTGVGGESYALVRWSEYDGAPAVGLEVVHLTRLGRAVLIDTAGNEGGAGPDREADIEHQIDGQIAATVAVVDAMCRFTESGC